ncbi:MAG: hypothetical protein ACHBN1_07345 [Heteroscytonema crispum UTEX LB 1556]
MTEKNSLSNKDESQEVSIIFLSSIENIIKTIAGIGIIFYILGFIIVQTYLNKWGINDLNLLYSRYISVGLYYSFFLVSFSTICFIAVLILVYIIYKSFQITQFIIRIYKRGLSNRTATKHRAAVISLIILTLILLLIIALIFPVLKFAFNCLIRLIYGEEYFLANIEDLKSFIPTNRYVQEISVFQNWIYKTIYIWVLVIVCLAARYIILKILFPRISFKKINLDSKIVTSFILFITLILFTFSLLRNAQEYSLRLYPLIDRAVGGGKAVTVQLITEITDENKLTTLDRILSPESKSQTKIIPVCLLDQSDKNYFLLVPINNKQLPKKCIISYSKETVNNLKAIQVDKSLVKGINYIVSTTE